ncbi:MAG: hypothetical protein DMG21_14010 [Acidobacteria bacterium]|nr:MAG: hypothetical protein DMG21_14010 [Acidobacteriota bacterium]
MEDIPGFKFRPTSHGRAKDNDKGNSTNQRDGPWMARKHGFSPDEKENAVVLGRPPAQLTG